MNMEKIRHHQRIRPFDIKYENITETFIKQKDNGTS